MLRNLTILLWVLLFLITGCAKKKELESKDKDKESNTSTTTSTTTTLPVSGAVGVSHFKYGETVLTDNQWEVSFDASEPIEFIQLSNGWSVEVKHE